MKKPTPFKFVLIASSIIAAILLWLKFLDKMEPEPYDGEAEGEIDPDLPYARPGDILLFNRAKGMNRIITWFTKSPFYHVGIAMGDGKVVEARIRGVVIRDLMGPDGDKRFEIIPAENVGGQEVALAAMEWALTQVGDGYDPVNILGIVLDRLLTCTTCSLTLPNRWACGEFVATAFAEAGEDLFPDYDIHTVVPADYAFFLPEAS